jgi:hypothetical protein
MNLSKKGRKQFYSLALIVCLVFQLCIVISPSVDEYNSTPVINKLDYIIGLQTPLDNKQGRLYFLSVWSGNETLNEIETNLSIDRNSWNSSGLILRFFNTLLPYTGLGVMILCFGYVINKKEHKKSILSILLGGHAPPVSLLF